MRFHEKAALNGQQGLFVPESTWTPVTELPTLRNRGIKRFCVDVETYDPDLKTKGPGVRRGAKIIGLGVGIQDGPKFYLPIGHAAGNLDRRLVLSWAKEELDPLDAELVGANLGYDMDFLAEEGITFPNVKAFHDVQVAEAIIDENKVGSYNLDAISMEHLGEGKDTGLLLEAGKAMGLSTLDQIMKNLHRFPANLVGPYGEGDVDRPLRILPIQMKKMDAEELIPVYTVERKLTPILVQMRRRGVPVNEAKVNELRKKLIILRDRWVAEMKRLAGPRAELMEPDSLVKALKDRGIEVPYTKGGPHSSPKPSITKPMLERHQKDELVLTILNGRKMNTLINTFVDGQILGHLIKGRVHPSWNQIKGDDGGTVGRLAGAHPNMQFIPARDAPWQEEELSPLVRGVFEPEPGEVWQRDDCSQIEYRFLVHYAVGQGADKARRMYNEDRTTSFHNLCASFLNADVKDKNVYRKIKILNFCKVFGGAEDKVAQTAGISRDEAVDFIEKYDTELPFVKATYDAAASWAGRRGFVVTILNRRQRFPNWGPGWYRDEFPAKLFKSREEAVEHYIKNGEEYRGRSVRTVERVGTFTALCRKLQVSAADLMKKSMVDIHEAGIDRIIGYPMITVHDELGHSIPHTKEGEEAGVEVTNLMENAVKLRVPVLVERSRGAHWGECL